MAGTRAPFTVEKVGGMNMTGRYFKLDFYNRIKYNPCIIFQEVKDGDF